MNIIEVKNSLVKLCYEDELVLSGFIKITDNQNSYIAQVLHLEATRIGKVAIAKLIFKYNNGISAYDGSIPSLRAELEPIDSSILLNSLEKTEPLNLCNLAQQPNKLIVDFNILKDNPIICAEKFFTTKVLLNNLALQLQARKQKLVVFDTVGIFKTNKITLTKDFKLPLNSSTINYIYEKGFEDATAESKAMIQAIFEELSEYSKTVEFIPFDTFKAVIDSEFMRTRLMQLVILKNKIKQIRDWNVFAQNEQDFTILKTKFETENTIVIDISCIQESLQKECIKYIYSVLKETDSEFYAFTPVTNENSDKFILKQIYDTENVHTSIICGYDYKYISELKKCSKNMLMFTPLKQQKDFGGYNIFLQKLAEDEFIAYGKMTKFVPLIAKLHQLRAEEIYTPKITETITQIQKEIPTKAEQPVIQQEQTIEEEPVVEEKTVIEPVILEEEPIPVEPVQTITEEPVTTEQIQTEEFSVEESQPEDEPNIDEEIISEPVQQEVQEIATEETPTLENVEIPVEKEIETPIVEAVETPAAVEIEPPVTEDIEMPIVEEVEVPVEEEIISEEIAENNEVEEEIISEEIAENNEVEEEIISEEIAENNEVEEITETSETTETNEVEEALETVPEIEDDDELSDDDLDMIEELSKPDEEIPIINQGAGVNGVNDINVDVNVASAVPQAAPQEVPQEVPQEENDISEASQESMPQPEPQQPQTADEEIMNAQMPSTDEPLQTRANTTPIVPVYPSDIPDEDKVNSDIIQQGDRVMHEEFGEGVVEKMINYGDKLLCSINFASVGRRLLNPEISEMKKI